VEPGFADLTVVLALAFAIPLGLALVPRLRVPAAVVELSGGIVVGPHVLGWAEPSALVEVLATIGLAMLLFLAGLEIDTRAFRATVLHRAGGALGGSVVLAAVAGLLLAAMGIVDHAGLVAVALTATSLGLVVPIVRDAGHAGSPAGQLTLAGAAAGEFAAIVALSLLFSMHATTTGARVQLLAGFVAVSAVIAIGAATSGRSTAVSRALLALQDTTAQIRVRGAMLLLALLVFAAERSGLETILGAFVAGLVVSIVDRDTMRTHPLLHVKLDAIGFGFVIPIFFVASGMRFDLDALTERPSTLLRVPVLLLALLVVRAVPAYIAFRPLVGARPALASGLLQSATLPVVLAATMIGEDLGLIGAATSAALVAAALVSCLLFPIVALPLLRAPEGDDGQLDAARDSAAARESSIAER
jgi:Kef-type K+ transport system membrane component KefB